mmetsp:Transcript_46/g.66  ORF Transcript_46/g.66 Transcript_46/m.66 type:complete len:290 (-) Transcript_46:686-1555(-)
MYSPVHILSRPTQSSATFSLSKVRKGRSKRGGEDELTMIQVSSSLKLSSSRLSTGTDPMPKQVSPSMSSSKIRNMISEVISVTSNSQHWFHRGFRLLMHTFVISSRPSNVNFTKASVVLTSMTSRSRASITETFRVPIFSRHDGRIFRDIGGDFRNPHPSRTLSFPSFSALPFEALRLSMLVPGVISYHLSSCSPGTRLNGTPLDFSSLVRSILTIPMNESDTALSSKTLTTTSVVFRFLTKDMLSPLHFGLTVFLQTWDVCLVLPLFTLAVQYTSLSPFQSTAFRFLP